MTFRNVAKAEVRKPSQERYHSDENQYKVANCLGSLLTVFSRKYNSSRLQIDRSLVGPSQSVVAVFVLNEPLGGDPVHG